MTETVQNETPQKVHWTQFPTTALTDRDGLPVDWTDHRSAHRAVCRLFPSRLPGDSETRRAEAGILYRIDLVETEPLVFVQSLTPPELVPLGHPTREISTTAWDFEAGTQVAFRVAVNPVVRTTRYFEDVEKKVPAAWSNQAGLQKETRTKGPRKQTARVVPVADMQEWLESKVGAALSDIQLVAHHRDTTGSGRHRLVVDTIDAVATVKDPQEFTRLRLEGVGRSKSYGCGLMTAVRISGVK